MFVGGKPWDLRGHRVPYFPADRRTSVAVDSSSYPGDPGRSCYEVGSRSPRHNRGHYKGAPQAYGHRDGSPIRRGDVMEGPRRRRSRNRNENSREGHRRDRSRGALPRRIHHGYRGRFDDHGANSHFRSIEARSDCTGARYDGHLRTDIDAVDSFEIELDYLKVSEGGARDRGG